VTGMNLHCAKQTEEGRYKILAARRSDIEKLIGRAEASTATQAKGLVQVDAKGARGGFNWMDSVLVNVRFVECEWTTPVVRHRIATAGSARSQGSLPRSGS
jgi:hypothetical protein